MRLFLVFIPIFQQFIVGNYGDIADFSINTTLAGGHALNNGIFDDSGNDLGMNYTLTMKFVQLATCEDLSKSMTTNVKVYFIGKEIDEKK